MSNLEAGYLVDHLTSYEVAMAILLAPVVVCLIFLSITKVHAPLVKGTDVAIHTQHNMMTRVSEGGMR